MYDELDLDMLGDERTALFLIMSDTDGTFAFLISLIYSILFNRLCERADDVYGGRLPIHVRCLIDEAANIGQIPNLERLMATIRSREISACLVLQAQSQLKALYKDNMDTIIGNCDASLFLGGKEETTLKSWNSLLGKETIDLYNTSVTKGNQESHGQNFQKLGKDLMSVDELAVMDGGIAKPGTAKNSEQHMRLKFCCTRRQRIILTSWESKSSPLSNLSGRNTPTFWNKNGKPILPISRPKMI